MRIYILVNCGVPMLPVNGTVDTPDHTREGASVDYRCDDGFHPSANFFSTCESSALWTPPPENHSCTFVTGNGRSLSDTIIINIFFLLL